MCFRTVNLMKVIFQAKKPKEMASLSLLTVHSTVVNGTRTNNKAMVFINGRKMNTTQEIGTKEQSKGTVS